MLKELRVIKPSRWGIIISIIIIFFNQPNVKVVITIKLA